MTLPEDLIKIRDELAEEHKLLTKDNGIESSSYHFKAGFNAAAEIFLKRERDNQKVFFDEIQWMELNKLQANNESLRQYGLEQFRLAQKLQARIEKLVGAIQNYLNIDDASSDVLIDAITADKEFE